MDIPEPIQLTKVLLLAVVLVSCSATDLRTRRIPNAILAPALMTGLGLSSLGGGFAGLLESIGGLLIGILMLLPFHLLGRMGAGDVKLLGVVGSLLGVWGVMVAGIATMVAGAVLGLAYIAWLFIMPEIHARLHQVARFSGGAPRRWSGVAASDIRTAEIPYAIAVSAGSVAAVIYLDLLPAVGVI